MENIIARKYATIEKLMQLDENELAELESVIDRFSSEDISSIEQYNLELDQVDAAIDRGEFHTHEKAIERLGRWKKSED